MQTVETTHCFAMDTGSINHLHQHLKHSAYNLVLVKAPAFNIL